MRRIAIFLCALTANAAQPWADAGVHCYCVDVQHSIRKPRTEGNITYVWGDARSWCPPDGEIVFVAAFPPCTHIAGSGARDWLNKGHYLLSDALELFQACLTVAEWSRAPYYIENPVGAISRHMRKPDFTFDPADFAGWLPVDRQQSEAYTKRTCLWTGGGFVMPEKRPVHAALGSMMHLMPPSDDRQDLRSASPLGFSIAVHHANDNRKTRSVAA